MNPTANAERRSMIQKSPQANIDEKSLTHRMIQGLLIKPNSKSNQRLSKPCGCPILGQAPGEVNGLIIRCTFTGTYTLLLGAKSSTPRTLKSATGTICTNCSKSLESTKPIWMNYTTRFSTTRRSIAEG